jgi:glycosyltransferase involved in cell wall biosynthesis
MIKKHILFLIPTLTGGGAERVFLNIVNNLDRSKYQITLAVVDIRCAVFLSDIHPDVELIDLHTHRVRYALAKIIYLVWRSRPDVVFSTLSHLNLALAVVRFLLPSKIKFIARESNTVSSVLLTLKMRLIWRVFYRLFYRKHDLVVCQCSYMQADLVRNYNVTRDKTVVINNPVDLQSIWDSAVLPFDLSLFKSDKINMVGAGRLVRQKGFDILIEALTLIENSKINLVILGEGPELAALKNLVMEARLTEQIHFAGFQSNPYPWLKFSDIFILPSRYEGFPNVALEALACGTPVISTMAPGGAPEILRDIPGCFLADEVSAESLAVAINNWTASDRRRVDPSWVDKYRLSVIIPQFEKIFE